MGGDNQSHERHQFDKDVHGRTRSVFEGIADCVACYSSLVRIRPFVIGFSIDFNSFFKTFLCIIPSSAGIVLEHSHQNTRNGNTGQKPTQHFRAKDKSNHNGNEQSNGAGSYHLAQARPSRNFNALFVFWFCFVFHNSWNFAELPTDFIYHIHGGTTNGSNGKSREDKRNHSPYKQSGEYICLVNINGIDASYTYKSGE